jgi:hypothetical protein
MPEFKSSLSSKSFTGQQLREFDIPDESNLQAPLNRRIPSREQQYDPFDEDPIEVERQMKEAREVKLAKMAGKERLNDGARRRIEMLIGMTRTTREVDLLEGNIFILQTLRSKEMRDALMVASTYDGTIQSPFEIRRQLLARSLVQVAGVEVAQFVGSDNLDARLALIDDLDESLLNRLFDEYQKMVDESRDKFSLKTVEDAKGVSEDLKK